MSLKNVIRKHRIDYLLGTYTLSKKEKELLDYLDSNFKCQNFEYDTYVCKHYQRKLLFFNLADRKEFIYQYDSVLKCLIYSHRICHDLIDEYYFTDYSDIQNIIKEYFEYNFKIEIDKLYSDILSWI